MLGELRAWRSCQFPGLSSRSGASPATTRIACWRFSSKQAQNRSMSQPSKPSIAGCIFLSIFGLPFLGMGLLFVFVQLSKYNSLTPLEAIGAAIFGLAFASLGFGLIYGSFAGYRRLKKQAEIEAAHQQSPWLWRADWAERRAKGHNKDSEIGWWLVATVLGGMLLSFAAMIGPKHRGNADLTIFVAVCLSLTGAALIAGALRATVRQRRFGNAYFEFDALPFSPAERRVSGRIHLKLNARAEHGFNLRIECARTITVGSGNNRCTSRVVLWQADKNVPSGAIAPGPLGRAIPVDFILPSDAQTTSHQNMRDQTAWTLYAQADVPGVNYTDKFEIPVFRTPQSVLPASDAPAAASVGAKSFELPRIVTNDEDSEAIARPANAKVIVSMQSGRTEFYFPAFRNLRRALVLFAVCLLWNGPVYLMYQKHVWFFLVPFGLSSLFIIAGFLHVTFGNARICAGNGEITWRRGILGMGTTKRLPFSNVGSIVPFVSLRQGGSSRYVPFAIQLRTKDGRDFTLVDEIASGEEARWVVSQIESLAGLKADTRVRVDLPFGTVVQPPPLGTTGNQM